MKTIQLLLTENVDKLGIVGDVVAVKPGYARNYLVPHGLATDPTKGNIARLSVRRAQAEAELKIERAALEALFEKLTDCEITLERTANEQGVLFGGISTHDISQALIAQGLGVDERAIRIGENIKRLDTYEITVVLADDLRATIKLWVVSDKPADELDGERAQEHVKEITVYHRSLGSAEWHAAADALKRRLAGIGLEATSIDEPLNNTTRIGNYTIPYAWEPRDAILKVVSPEERTLVNFRETPTCINSWSGATPPAGVIAEVVHVGDGTRNADYAGVDVKGKIVFTDQGYSWRVHALAVEKYGAIGFINDDIREIPYVKTRAMYPDSSIRFRL